MPIQFGLNKANEIASKVTAYDSNKIDDVVGKTIKSLKESALSLDVLAKRGSEQAKDNLELFNKIVKPVIANTETFNNDGGMSVHGPR